MNQLENHRNNLSQRLKHLKAQREILKEDYNKISSDLKDKIYFYNQLVETLNSVKDDYKNKSLKIERLQKKIKQYKKAQRGPLVEDYLAEIKNIIRKVNCIDFDFNIKIFKNFDILKSINTMKFPILDKKVQDIISRRRIDLKDRLLNMIRKLKDDTSKLNDLIFYINFLIKYEKYFGESIFPDFIYSMIESSFLYHFASERNSNRIDKPEWMFDFLVDKYSIFHQIFDIYSDINPTDYSVIIMKTQKLVYLKIKELIKTKSDQKRNLILNFASKFKDFSKRVFVDFNCKLDISDITYLLSKTNHQFIEGEIERIHGMSYLQWFEEYKMLLKSCVFYFVNYNVFDKDFCVDNFIKSIIHHSRLFLENLRFIKRDEIRVPCFIFSQYEGIKEYMQDLINEMMLSSSMSTDFVSNPFKLISEFNLEIIKLIRKLINNDLENAFKRIQYFNFASQENRRLFIVNVDRFLLDYDNFIYPDFISRYFIEKIDFLLCENILLKTKFNSEEYLEFFQFFETLQNVFKQKEDMPWRSGSICKCIEAVLKKKKLKDDDFDEVYNLYIKS